MGGGPDPRAILVLAFGLVAVVQGVRIRTGRDRRWFTVSRGTNQVAVMRNGPFLLIPIGILFICAGLVAVLPNEGEWSALGDALGRLGAIALPVLVIGLSAPPPWLMPTWYRREMAAGGIPRDKFDWAFLAFSVAGAVVLSLAFVYIWLTAN